MPVNIQLSKISIASAISSNEARLHSNSLLITASLPERMVGPDGIEPSTSPLSGVRSSHLSYGPRCSQHWWSWSGSNRRPPECKSGALPAELQPLLKCRGMSSCRGLRDVIEASWMQGSGISNPQPLADSLQNFKWRSGSVLTDRS